MRLPPGPNFSSLTFTWKWLRDPFRLLDDCARRFGETFTLRLPGFPPTVVFSDPAAVKEIFADDGTGMHAGEMAKPLAVFLGSSSVLLLDGPEHMRHRKLLLPPFRGERMQSYAETMIGETHAVIDTWRDGEPFTFHEQAQSITLRVILETVFGFRAGPKRDAFEKQIKRVLDLAAWPPLLLPMMQVDLGPWSPWGKWLRESRKVDKLLFAEMKERRRAADTTRNDVMSLLLSARDDHGAPMTDEELRDELVTLLVAGHETTATSLAWALSRIAARPDVERRLRAELETAGPLTPESVSKLEYLDAVIRESLRLDPVIPVVGRMLKAPTRIGGWDLPAGTGVLCSIYLAHRRTETYGNPRDFDPERFRDRKFSPSELFPFGGGVRRCLGMSFAVYEMKMVLATMLSRAKLSLADHRPIVPVRRGVTLAPSGGLRIVAHVAPKRAVA
jgi:cytochrome P450